MFDWARQQGLNQVEDQFQTTIEKGHGRLEIRRYGVMENTEHLLGAEKWLGLRSIGLVESERRVNGQISDVEQRYYLLSLEGDVQRFADAVRHHHLCGESITMKGKLVTARLLSQCRQTDRVLPNTIWSRASFDTITFFVKNTAVFQLSYCSFKFVNIGIV